MGLFSRNLRHISSGEKKMFEDECFNDSLIGPQGKEQKEKPQYFFEGFTYSDGPEDEEELTEDNEDEISPEAEVILSTYNRYQLIEITEDDETYYIIMAPDGSVMTEDFYAWAESEGIDFDSLSTSDKVANFADYVDSIKS